MISCCCCCFCCSACVIAAASTVVVAVVVDVGIKWLQTTHVSNSIFPSEYNSFIHLMGAVFVVVIFAAFVANLAVSIVVVVVVNDRRTAKLHFLIKTTSNYVKNANVFLVKLT